MSIIVITPSRNRPDRAAEGYDAFLKTRTMDSSEMIFVVDEDDEDFMDYIKAGLPVVTYDHSGGGMGPPMNAAAIDQAPHYDIVGFLGDDHRFRTKGWDEAISEALVAGGFAYGNDLIRSDIPTNVFITSDIVLELGWFCLPGAYHLYLDNTWADLGNMTDSLSYLPEVIIEHVHPTVGKTDVDAGYQRVNHPAMYQHDSQVYGKWCENQRAIDIERIGRWLK